MLFPDLNLTCFLALDAITQLIRHFSNFNRICQTIKGKVVLNAIDSIFRDIDVLIALLEGQLIHTL